MEGQVLEEFVVCKDQQNQMTMLKGKRTKRQRLPSPLRLAMPMPSSTSSISAGRIASTDNSSTSSPELRDSTQEEEDMANCLILLAQGNHARKASSSSSEPVNVAQPHSNYVYQCKTCNRFFSSFQALGGHRASHKKPKPNNIEEKQALTFLVNEKRHDLYDHAATTTSTDLSLQLSSRALYSTGMANNKPKVHECSICGAEFSSGQALGGHMRRHRTFANTSATTSSSEAKKPRNVLKLDLNLPAPEDDLQGESKFPFQSKGKVLVFSASSLVDCPY